MKRILLFVAAALILSWQCAEAAPYTRLHAFEGAPGDGRTPGVDSTLVASSDGSTLYGMTELGGKYDCGTLFQIDATGANFKLIHSFDGYDAFSGKGTLNTSGSKDDGGDPAGTPVLVGSTLYGMTQAGGSNGLGCVYSVNTDGTGFQILHAFGGYALNDGSGPWNSLIVSGSTLYGMTTSGGVGLSEGVVFSINLDGSNYKVLQSLGGEGPQGQLLIWGSSLYGMTSAEIFTIQTNGSNFLPVHMFQGGANDGLTPKGSLVRSGSYLYGMTSQGGQNNVGTIFQINLIGSVFQVIHSFAMDEAYGPTGDLVLSGSMLYGMSRTGVTNYYHNTKIGNVGEGAVFQINTNGTGYSLIHTFEYPAIPTDGADPLGSPMIVGNQLFGMTSLGGSEGLTEKDDAGVIFALTLSGSSSGGSGGGSGPPAISTISLLPDGKVGTAYHQQLAATGGTSPYTWAVSEGHLPPGLILSAVGVLSGKPTKGGVAAFTIKVTGHDKETSSQPFSLTVEEPPTLVITTPKAAEKITTPTFTVTGTAADPVGGVAGVFYELNGGPWLPAQSANNYANWSIPNLPLPADADTLNAYAVDTFGNASKTNTVKFTYYVTRPLVVEVQPVGSGSFSPPDNGKSFQIGAAVPITAKAAQGFTFLDWTDGNGIVISKQAALKFVMSSNLTLIANFVASGSHQLPPSFIVPTYPFQETAGNYAGLFAPAGDASQVSDSGAIRLTLTQAGIFSGKLAIGADSLPFTGKFDPSGKAAVSISGSVACVDCSRAQVPPSPQIILARKKFRLTASLQLDFAHQTISGGLTDGASIAQVAADRGAFNTTNPAQEFQGTYPVTITEAGASSPTWTANGTITVDALGNVSFTVVSQDGTHANQTSLISSDGTFPLYTVLHGDSSSGNGSLWAWLQITNGTIRSLPNASALITFAGKMPAQIAITPRAAMNQQ